MHLTPPAVNGFEVDAGRHRRRVARRTPPSPRKERVSIGFDALAPSRAAAPARQHARSGCHTHEPETYHDTNSEPMKQHSYSRSRYRRVRMRRACTSSRCHSCDVSSLTSRALPDDIPPTPDSELGNELIDSKGIAIPPSQPRNYRNYGRWDFATSALNLRCKPNTTTTTATT